MTIAFLDMDGVIADFVSGVAAAHGRQSPYDREESFGVFEMDRLWGMSAEEFWAPVHPISYEFWSGLPPTPDARQIVDLLTAAVGVENICVLTAPADDAGCIPGKRDWMRRHFPELAKNMLFGSAKRFLAGPGRILVDDRDANIESFVNYGGSAVRVPRAWNALHRERANATGSVWIQLNKALDV